MSTPIALPGIDGANPLGFLCALGVLAALQPSAPGAKLAWERRAGWSPRLTLPEGLGPEDLVSRLAAALRGAPVAEANDAARDEARKQLDGALTKAKHARDSVKSRKLRGAERDAALAAEVAPLQARVTELRLAWLAALRDSVPSPELLFGLHVACAPEEYSRNAGGLLEHASAANRLGADFLAAFFADTTPDKSGRVPATPFCFTTGSGNQWFLDTARKLMANTSAERIRDTLFSPWTYRDERLSMRWDPIENKQYALLDLNPSSTGARTQWVANLLAYRGLTLFPMAPTSRGAACTGWSAPGQEPRFSWPLWQTPLGADAIRSLLQLEALACARPSSSPELAARGVVAAFRSRRLRVGNAPLYKINFSPAQAV
ncbi:MAG: type I-G CRISPR-associated protein, Cas3-extension family [Terriglobales bacterium]